MAKRILAIALLLGLGGSGFTAASGLHGHHHDELCEGFVPQNDLYIPANKKNRGGISEADFNAVLDRIAEIYTQEVKSKGGELQINRRWTDGTVNASAQQMWGKWIINMFGGLARHSAITIDGFALVACHEMGHHLAGAPKVAGWFGSTWASNEGASDYYATLKCLRRMWDGEDNEAVLASMEVDPLAIGGCERVYTDRADQLVCIRGAMAGASVAALFQDLRKETTKARLDTPDPKKVSRTDDRHPASQCRLDTYFAGAICAMPVSDALNDRDYRQGSCWDASRHDRRALRPRCWFKPNEPDPDPTTEPAPAPAPAPVPAPAPAPQPQPEPQPEAPAPQQPDPTIYW